MTASYVFRVMRRYTWAAGCACSVTYSADTPHEGGSRPHDTHLHFRGLADAVGPRLSLDVVLRVPVRVKNHDLVPKNTARLSVDARSNEAREGHTPYQRLSG
jgi:hypothetical protein